MEGDLDCATASASTVTSTRAGRGEYLRRALLLRRVYLERVGFHPLPKFPLIRANSWVQDLCKHPSILPCLAPPKVKLHKMGPWEQPPP